MNVHYKQIDNNNLLLAGPYGIWISPQTTEKCFIKSFWIIVTSCKRAKESHVKSALFTQMYEFTQFFHSMKRMYRWQYIHSQIYSSIVCIHPLSLCPSALPTWSNSCVDDRDMKDTQAFLHLENKLPSLWLRDITPSNSSKSRKTRWHIFFVYSKEKQQIS